MVYKDKCAWLGLDDDCGSLFPGTVKVLCYIFVLLALLRKKQTNKQLKPYRQQVVHFSGCVQEYETADTTVTNMSWHVCLMTLLDRPVRLDSRTFVCINRL